MTERRILTRAELMDLFTAALIRAPQDAKRKLGMRGPERSAKEIAIYLCDQVERGGVEITAPVHPPYRPPACGAPSVR